MHPSGMYKVIDPKYEYTGQFLFLVREIFICTD